jgi:hypothetical protein
MAQVKFLRTLSVSNFKNEVKSSTLSLIRSPKTSKLFLVDENGTVVAGASEDSVNGDCVVSHIEIPTGETLWYMHKRSTSNPPIKTF